jgi:hypothetical protein
MDEHQVSAACIPVWKVLAHGHKACISQHLCSEKWPANHSRMHRDRGPPSLYELWWATFGFALAREGWNPVLKSHSRLVGMVLQIAA